MSPRANPASRALPGRPWPMGATLTDAGVNLAVFSARAERVELCLFDPAGRETGRLALPERSGDVWHGQFPELRPGQAYGLRAHGPWDPRRGQRFNPAKLLLDPYAVRLAGAFRWSAAHGLDAAGDDDLVRDPRDTAADMPKAVVTAPLPPLGGPRPAVPWDRTVIYEAHVKGLTMRHPAVPAAARGRYAGLAHPAVIEHLLRLGVTTVELLPCQAFLDERHLVRRGLVNYWGYNPMLWLAPEPRYAEADPVAEFRAMAAGLHAAGLELILDVVLNHTAESDEHGPTLSFRGLDNVACYRLAQGGRRYRNDAGCGNAPDLQQPGVLRLAMDALRFWVTVMGVDGFRFDLATALGRTTSGFDPTAPLLSAIRQDPVLASVKLIAEPWDIGPGGYVAGRFPSPFAEWHDGFRDAARAFWRGDAGAAPGLAGRLLGSADRFAAGVPGPAEPGPGWAAGGRDASAAINYVAAHDGFTLRDLVSYGRRHNEANGDGNRDGHAQEPSVNHGVEGPSGDPAIEDRRRRHVRNLLATLFLSQGTPMLAMGDEALRSQGGNNNAYCHDNGTSWYHWDGILAEEGALIGFVARLAALRRRHPALRRRRFRHGLARDERARPDAGWWHPDGRPMTPADWEAPALVSVALLLGGMAGIEPDAAGAPQPDADLLLLLHAGPAPLPFILPPAAGWRCLLDTACPAAPAATVTGQVTLAAGSLLLLASATDS